MPGVSQRMVQGDFRIRGQFDFAGPGGVIRHRDFPDFHIHAGSDFNIGGDG